MRQLSMVMAMALMLVFGAGIVTAAQKEGAGSSKKPATNTINAPQLASGEIVNVIPGKSVQIKQENGKLRTYGLSKKTRIDGELKVGEMASVSSAGRWAQEVTVHPEPDKMTAAESFSKK